jgi:hypothetical protein
VLLPGTVDGVVLAPGMLVDEGTLVPGTEDGWVVGLVVDGTFVLFGTVLEGCVVPPGVVVDLIVPGAVAG